MADEPVETMLELACRLATEAADIALERVGKSVVTRKADNSVVTDVDHAIQNHIVRAIAERYHDHALWAEETLENPDAHPSCETARYCWVIDPLDGTRNFVWGLPCFATAIAVLDRGQPVAGVVFEHNTRMLCSAATGRGTTLNGKPVRVREVSPDADMLIGTPSSKDALTAGVVRHWAGTRDFVLRNFGSTAFHLALVATGALAGAFGKRCKIWDVAAGALLVIEAGGRFTDPFGTPALPFRLDAKPDQDLPCLAAAPATHARLLESIKTISP